MNDKGMKEENYWKCSNCGYTVNIQSPPNECPSCKTKCEFVNVTCYRPECGFRGIDPELGK
jgi:rubrerythrin